VVPLLIQGRNVTNLGLLRGGSWLLQPVYEFKFLERGFWITNHLPEMRLVDRAAIRKFKVRPKKLYCWAASVFSALAFAAALGAAALGVAAFGA